MTQGSVKAIEFFKFLLAEDPSDYESRYLLNLAYNTLGKYANVLPSELRINSPLLSQPGSRMVKDIAIHEGLATTGLAGGVIADDFNQDGRIDLAISSWDMQTSLQLFLNLASGWQEVTQPAGLQNIPGGLNIIQTDYNNDGWLDLFVGNESAVTGFLNPCEFYLNQQDGTFQEVAQKTGLNHHRQYYHAPTDH